MYEIFVFFLYCNIDKSRYTLNWRICVRVLEINTDFDKFLLRFSLFLFKTIFENVWKIELEFIEN